MQPEKSLKPPSTTKTETIKNIIKTDWRQTTNNLTMYFTVDQKVNLIDECQIKRIKGANIVITIYLTNSDIIEVHDMKFSEDLEWPPSCQRNIESSEVHETYEDNCVYYNI